MQKAVKKKNSYFKISLLIGTFLFLFATFVPTNIVLSQAEKCEPNNVIRIEEPKNYEVNTSIEIEKIKKRVKEFLSLDNSNPMTQNSHIYFNITNEILQYDALVSMAEQVVEKGIAVNTVENLRKSYPDMSESVIKYQQKLEFGRLYSQYAWILWKKNQLENAFDTIKKAMSYVSSPTPDDYIRLGIIEYENGKKQQGWEHISNALMEDTIIEERGFGYREAIYRIIKDKFGQEQAPAEFVARYRKQNAVMIPDLNLVTPLKTKVKVRQNNGKVTFIIFFSPSCSSCRQEIPSLKEVYDKFSRKDKVNFIFILNRPNMMQEAIALFEKSGIDKPIITVLEKGSVWDFIPAEPSVWIADKTGKLVFKHSGYKQGNDSIYERELSKLLINN